MVSKTSSSHYLIFSLLIFLFFVNFATKVAGECTCDKEEQGNKNNKSTIKYKVGALIAILVAGACGVSIPLLGKHVPALNPDKSLFFLIKSFAAGVILSTGFIHILPDAFKSLSNPCLKENPWANFPFTGLAAMVGAIGSLMIDALATNHYRKVHGKSAHDTAVIDDPENFEVHGHGHSHGPTSSSC